MSFDNKNENDLNENSLNENDLKREDTNNVKPTIVGSEYSNLYTKDEYVSARDINRPNYDNSQVQSPSYEDWSSGNNGTKKKKSGRFLKVAGCLVAIGIVFASGVMFTNWYIEREEVLSKYHTNDLPEDSVRLEISDVASVAPSASDDGLTGAEIYNMVSPSVVGIMSESISILGSSIGSGIIMSKDGYIITNHHVIEGGDKITVILHDGEKMEAEIIGSDSKTDLAILKVRRDSDLVPAVFGDSDKLGVGDRAYAIGSPGSLELQNTFTGGFISAINRDITVSDRVMTLVQTDATINPGNSGGPLINKYGQVIGINTIKIGSVGYEGLGFAIPINSAKDVLEELIAFGRVQGRPAIGISSYRSVSKETSAYFGIPVGIIVDSVDERSDAYAKGVKKGDIIVGADGEETPTVSDLNKIKEQHKAGEYMVLNIYRAGQNLDIKIMLLDEIELSE